MARDKIIKATGRARSHQKYITSSGEQVPGGSTLANIINFGSADPLMAWAIRLHNEGIDFKEYRREASDFGNAFHRYVECMHKGEEFPAGEYPGNYVEPAKIMAENFYRKLTDLGMTMVESEIQLVSDTERFGGTLDLVLRDKEGRLCLSDLKSSNSISVSHKCQVGGAYRILFREKYGEAPASVSLFRADRNPPHEVSVFFLGERLCEAAERTIRNARLIWELKPVLTKMESH